MKTIFIVYCANINEEYSYDTSISYWEKEEDARKEVEMLSFQDETGEDYFYCEVEMNKSEV